MTGNQYFLLPERPEPDDTRPRNAFGILKGFGEAYAAYYAEQDKQRQAMTIEERYDVTLNYEPHGCEDAMVAITVEHRGTELTICWHRTRRCVHVKNGPFFYGGEHYTLGNDVTEYKTLGEAITAAFPQSRQA